jgi:CRISPR-associated endonuclease/helicase Cas3
MLAAEKPLVCVSTQLIEAGVDIDFGSVIRSIAGLDSITQAAGRCNRNSKKPTGKVIVVNPLDEHLGRLKDISEGRNCAERVLQDFAEHPERFDHDILGVEAMRWFYENYFFRRANEMDYPLPAGDSLLTMLADNAGAASEYRRKHGAWPAIPFRQAFMTAARAFKAIDAPTQGVIVPYGEGSELIKALSESFDVRKDRDLLRKAQPYTVNLFDSDMRKLREQGAIFSVQEGVDIYHLNPRYYDQKAFGLSLEPIARWELCCDWTETE